MGEIEHAGTSKTMPAISDANEAAGGSRSLPVITSEDAGEVAGEIVAEPTAKTASPAGADKVAAERGMPPIPRPSDE